MNKLSWCGRLNVQLVIAHYVLLTTLSSFLGRKKSFYVCIIFVVPFVISLNSRSGFFFICWGRKFSSLISVCGFTLVLVSSPFLMKIEKWEDNRHEFLFFCLHFFCFLSSRHALKTFFAFCLVADWDWLCDYHCKKSDLKTLTAILNFFELSLSLTFNFIFSHFFITSMKDSMMFFFE